jgi:hypothetical protein
VISPESWPLRLRLHSGRQGYRLSKQVATNDVALADTAPSTPSPSRAHPLAIDIIAIAAFFGELEW